MLSNRLMLSTIALSFLCLTWPSSAHAAAERSFVGQATVHRSTEETYDQARSRAFQQALTAALRTGARELAGQSVPKLVVYEWVEAWDDFGTYRRVIAERSVGERVWVQVEVGVDEARFQAVIAASREVRDVLVAVVVQEEILRLPPPPDPAAETAVRQALLTAGYQVLDQRLAESIDDRDMLRALARGDEGAARWFQERFNADVLVYGEAFAEEVPGGGVYLQSRFTSMCELHWITLDTARELASFSRTSVAEGETPIQAAKVALAQAGMKAAADLLGMVELTGSATPIQVIVSRVAYFSTASDIGASLRTITADLGRVSRPRLDLQNQTCSWDLTTSVSVFEIADALRRLDRPRLRITELTGQRVVAEVVD